MASPLPPGAAGGYGIAEVGNGGALSDQAASSMLPFIAAFIETSARDPRALWSSFSMIVFSEIGDKTFLIAAILAMRHSRLVVFGGAFTSLVVMSILSSALGATFPSLLPKSLTTFCASLLFFVFGAKMWKEGREMSGGEMGEEWEEAKREIEEEEHEMGDVGDREQQGLEEASPSPRALASVWCGIDCVEEPDAPSCISLECC